MRLPDARADFRRIKAGSNNDSGSIFSYEFDPPAKVRFLRFHMLGIFPDDMNGEQALWILGLRGMRCEPTFVPPCLSLL